MPLFRNPHAQTVAGHYWPRHLDSRRYPVRIRLCPTEPGVEVREDSQQPEGGGKRRVVLVHGLESSSEAGYMLSMAQAALDAGFAVHRLNLRTCGGTERLCPTLYHSGLTTDLRWLVQDLNRRGGGPVWLVGFSLGGNLVLKLAGELGERGPELLEGVCAVSTPIDLSACAHRLGEPANRIYERRFLRRMRTRLARTGRYRASDFRGIGSLVELDDRITAPAFGFNGAEHYYRTQSSNQFLERIRVPTLLVQAKDDTLIPFSVYGHEAFGRNPFLTLLATDHGGHLGFLARERPRLWLDVTVLEWMRAQNGTKPGVGASTC